MAKAAPVVLTQHYSVAAELMCEVTAAPVVLTQQIPSEVYKFASERLLTIMSIFLSGCMLSGKVPSALMHEVIIPLLKCKSIFFINTKNPFAKLLPMKSKLMFVHLIKRTLTLIALVFTNKLTFLREQMSINIKIYTLMRNKEQCITMCWRIA